jgi:hypothetical protein
MKLNGPSDISGTPGTRVIMDHSYRSVFARTMRELQQQATTDQMDLANFLEVSLTTVVNWLSGEKMPGLTRVVGLAKFYGLDPQQFLLEIHAASAPDPRIRRMGLQPEQDVLAAVLAHDLAANPSKGASWCGVMKEPDLTPRRAEVLTAFRHRPDGTLTYKEVRAVTGLPRAVVYLTLGEFVSAGWLSAERKPADPASNKQPCRCWRLTQAGDMRIKRDSGGAEHAPTGTSDGH